MRFEKITKNKKGVMGVVFLIISILVVSSVLVITINKMQIDYDQNKVE